MGNPTKLLVVDDQEFVLAIVRKMLEQVGFENVQVARDGNSGLDVARQIQPDLIICDIQMRPMDGFAFVAALHGDPELNAIPVIMLTAHQDALITNRAMEMGVSGLLSKPIQAAALKEKIDQVLWLKLGNSLSGLIKG